MTNVSKTIVGIIALALFLLVGGVMLLSKGSTPAQTKENRNENIVSENGLHWHAQLTIEIKGVKQEIPADVGRQNNQEQPIHTHNEDHQEGVIHMEVPGVVTKDDLKLGRFFQIWGKQFNQNCIFDSCNGESDHLTMLVNGVENKEFQDYSMRDGDKIEIKFE